MLWLDFGFESHTHLTLYSNSEAISIKNILIVVGLKLLEELIEVQSSWFAEKLENEVKSMVNKKIITKTVIKTLCLSAVVGG